MTAKSSSCLSPKTTAATPAFTVIRTLAPPGKLRGELSHEQSPSELSSGPGPWIHRLSLRTCQGGKCGQKLGGLHTQVHGWEWGRVGL